MEKIREKVGVKWLWARFDQALGEEKISDFCRRVGVKENTVYSQRTRGSMPSEEFLSLYSCALGVSQTWLLTGLDPIEYSPEVKQVVDVLSKDPSKLHVVRVVLGLE